MTDSLDGSPGPVPAPPAPRRPVAMGLRIAWVRLRSLVVLVAAFVVVGRWDVLRNYWDRLTRSGEADATARAVSNDTEYFCPMDPGVVSDWPGKCSICNMALVRRRRGEAVALPDGVVARMQFSPYRLQLAGIRTEPVVYRPLAREVEAAGVVGPRDGEGPALAEAEVFEEDVPLLAEGRAAEVHGRAFPGRGPFVGTVRGVTATADDPPRFRVRLEVEDPGHALRPGMTVEARVAVPVAEVEPFRSMPSGAPAMAPGEPRAVYSCPDHPETLRAPKDRCPIDGKAPERRPLADDQRLRWWCPMHPAVTADGPDRSCEACGGMALVPRVVTFRPEGRVLAVAEGAVIDTGTRTVVYVERGPGMFDGVAVVLGPRCGGHYPVVRGLEAGDRVAVAGAFLIDAETRLNPSVAAAYFGAARPPGEEVKPPSTSPAAVAPDLAALSPEDRALVARQKTCPVTGKPLGSMGTPEAVVVEGRRVFLCCSGCEEKLRREPGKYLAKVPGL